MEIPASLPSAPVSPLFSDQSHLLFYACSSSSRCKLPIKSHFHTMLSSTSPLPVAFRRRSFLPPLHSASPSSPDTTVAGNSSSELDLLQELATLKAQIKLKKKQLKAIAKDRKAALKQTKAKAKGESSLSSSSSSSSEASDGVRMPLSMRLLQKDLSQNRDEKFGAGGCEPRGADYTDVQEGRNEEEIAQCAQSRCEPVEVQANAQSPRSSIRDAETMSRPSQRTLGGPRVHAISGSIEVCVGGKCKKAGSQQLLSSLKAQIPARACVEAAARKCMGRCGSAINVKVGKEDTNPQHHSHVRVDDAGLILSHHFGLGPPLSGLPHFSNLCPTNRSVSNVQV